MARILFLHEVGYFEKPIFEMHEFPEHLSKRGHEVGFLDFQELSGYEKSSLAGRSRSGRVVPGSQIHYFSQTNALKGLASRLFAVIAFPSVFQRVLKEFKPDIVISFSVPTSGWQALYICRRLGIPFLFRALDVSHKIRETRLSTLVKLAEKYIYRKSDWISCNNPAMRDYCVSLGANEFESSVDLPPLDLSHFRLVKRAKPRLRDTLGISEGAPIVMYMGSFFYFSGLAEVIQSLSTIASKPFLVLIGGGEQEDYLRDLTSQLKIEEVVKFTGYVPYQELPNYFAIADVAINPMTPSLVSDTALPNKVLQYMASGLPVVSTQLRGLSSIFENSGGLRLVGEPLDVLPAALEVANDPNKLQYGKYNAAVVQELFSVNSAVDRFERVIKNLCDKI